MVSEANVARGSRVRISTAPHLKWNIKLMDKAPRYVIYSIYSNNVGFLYEDLTVNQSGKFVEKSNRGNLVSLSQCIFSDHLTPTLAYRCLVKENDHEAPSFLIESVEPGLHAGTVVSIEPDLYCCSRISNINTRYKNSYSS